MIIFGAFCEEVKGEPIGLQIEKGFINAVGSYFEE